MNEWKIVDSWGKSGGRQKMKNPENSIAIYTREVYNDGNM